MLVHARKVRLVEAGFVFCCVEYAVEKVRDAIEKKLSEVSQYFIRQNAVFLLGAFDRNGGAHPSIGRHKNVALHLGGDHSGESKLSRSFCLVARILASSVGSASVLFRSSGWHWSAEKSTQQSIRSE